MGLNGQGFVAIDQGGILAEIVRRDALGILGRLDDLILMPGVQSHIALAVETDRCGGQPPSRL